MLMTGFDWWCVFFFFIAFAVINWLVVCNMPKNQKTGGIITIAVLVLICCGITISTTVSRILMQ